MREIKAENTSEVNFNIWLYIYAYKLNIIGQYTSTQNYKLVSDSVFSQQNGSPTKQ